MGDSVLIVDDDQSIREFLTEALEGRGYTVAQAADGSTGVSMVANWNPDVVLLDVQMPKMGGVTALNRILEKDPHLGVIMITSVDEVDTVRRTLRSGAYDYLIKPLDFPVVLETIDRAIQQRKLQLELNQYRESLELLVYERTQELQQALERIEGTYTQTILALGSALETRDVETREHSVRVAQYTLAICRNLGITDQDRLKTIERGAFLHDIGKIGVPDQILRKPGPLTKEEWVIMKTHPMIGVNLLKDVEFLKEALAIVRSHHERWDGGGYPDGIEGNVIPLEARAFAVADALDAITSDRPYREGKSLIDARRIIAQASGRQFDPDAVAALQKIGDNEVERIRYQATLPYDASGGTKG